MSQKRPPTRRESKLGIQVYGLTKDVEELKQQREQLERQHDETEYDVLYAFSQWIWPDDEPSFSLLVNSSFSTREQFEGWYHKLIEALLARAVVQPGDEPRAACPACGSCVQSVGSPGFTHPTGLERHLYGSHNAHRCIVTKLARQRAYRHFKQTEQERLDTRQQQEQ